MSQADEVTNTLEISGLSVEYRTRGGTVHAVNGLDLTIERGKTLGLVGETGAGKTTTGLAILGMIPDPPGVVTSGSIVVNGENILEKNERQLEEMRGRVVSMIFQDPMTSLNPVLTVEEQIAEVLRIHETAESASATERAREMLELVGIPQSRGTEYPHQFSGGMRQRAMIAIALACNPELLIADEPTTALDVTIQAQVLELMRALKLKYQTSMLLVTHDLGIVAETCDTVSIMYAGRVVEHGIVEDIFDNPRHPYTRGLFNSLPKLHDRTAMLKPIRGIMPDPSRLPEGCSFCSRCDYAMEVCGQDKPPRVKRTASHYVECHLYTPENIERKGAII